MNVVVIGGSNSRASINRKLVQYVASQIHSSSQELINLSEWDLPLFSVDRELADGIPTLAQNFADYIDAADLILLSLAENNGTYNVGFKNLLDWTSRIKGRKMWGEKPMFLMATSPGARGGATVLEIAAKRFSFMGAEVIETYSLPKFNEFFNEELGVKDEVLKLQLEEIIQRINVRSF